MRTAAFIAGRKAALDSLAPSLNPFELGTAEAAEWTAGWQDGLSEVNRYAEHKIRQEQRRRWGGK